MDENYTEDGEPIVHHCWVCDATKRSETASCGCDDIEDAWSDEYRWDSLRIRG